MEFCYTGLKVGAILICIAFCLMFFLAIRNERAIRSGKLMMKNDKVDVFISKMFNPFFIIGVLVWYSSLVIFFYEKVIR